MATKRRGRDLSEHVKAKAPPLRPPIFKDKCGDLWYVDYITTREHDQAWCVFRRTVDNNYDSDCSEVLGIDLTRIDNKRDKEMVYTKFFKFAVKQKWERII